MTDNRLAYLIARYLSQEISALEQEEFRLLIAASDDEQLGESLSAVWENYKTAKDIPSDKSASMLAHILKQQAPTQEIKVHFMRRGWVRWAAAAVIVFAIATIAVVVSSDRHSSDAELVSENKTDVPAPRINKAMITLSDGRTVALDSLNSGMLVQQGNVTVTKTAGGKIVYSGQATEMLYNTLTNPRGSKVIDVALADGSHVWLNAGSSVTYPIDFIGKERKVTITGEAYFEVAHDETKPFYVSKGEMEVKVLGTHFNVNAYEDERDIKVTLLEGSVKVNAGAATVLLKPGEQGIVPANTAAVFVPSGRQLKTPGTGSGNGIYVTSNIDLDAVMAWRSGMFNFSKVSLQEVMRQLSRWYDVEIEYQGEIAPRKFSGKIQRDLHLSEVLDGLKDIGVHFKIEGKKLTVME